MDQGKIVQKGMHKDLIQQPGLYQSLVYSAEALEPV
jgi:ABC-type transport system involved in Fe-S cluster assembly fused permease/ATPase subunit